jgi:hypothetical protein
VSDRSDSFPLDLLAPIIGAGNVLADIVATGNDAPADERARALEDWQRMVLALSASATERRKHHGGNE